MKISIVTPSFNSAKFIGQTIESVLSQAGDFEIDYIIVDNLSDDGTADIIAAYVKRLDDGTYPLYCRAATLTVLSGKDAGMYDAVGKGFDQATGEIYAWINADDFYLQGAFATIARVFKTLPEVSWLKGITAYCGESSSMSSGGRFFLYRQDWIRDGVYGRTRYFIQQDSVFWRKELWDVSGGTDRSLKAAGDYALWVSFAEYAKLYVMPITVSCFRRVSGQLSQDIAFYQVERDRIIDLDPIKEGRRRRLFLQKPSTSSFWARLRERWYAGKGEYLMIRFALDGTPIVWRVSHASTE